MRVLITGASRGIGAGIARKLAHDALARGETPHLALTASRQSEELAAIVAELEGLGARATALVGDMADPASPARLVEEALAFCQGLDGVVSNVGIMAPGRLAELDQADWDRLFDVNVRGTWLLAKAVYPALKASRGSLVNIASMVGVQPHPGSGAYSSSKAAVIMLSQQLAQEWAADGVRVNSISPGMIHTSATDKLYQHPEVAARREKVIPLHEIGQPAHIAGVVAFLLSENAAYVTGQNLLADGGFAGSIMGHIPGLPSKG
ncbi:SDR family NAD(P)-dependent oxidoreductase [Halomonas urumqiensis]|uniref:Short-chain dehydrogenase n=1 Tax=Halomonas urumqiensis TaxID=1684789 RepID=A0A2N7UJ68_9GAMM|nr:SDR family NAD(P)-dependent oxidoreductase [Halomonas urumqiensis]PMR80450.1 short-chain dehydrogenase [Halomonas urumqiensis]PTB01705.1 SDR family NAD(P)-dependent oxidoreductase [Halomonas urumqiensis]GHE22202.1 oxidoreductase [Halomonas urumqiensis]